MGFLLVSLSNLQKAAVCPPGFSLFGGLEPGALEVGGGYPISLNKNRLKPTSKPQSKASLKHGTLRKHVELPLAMKGAFLKTGGPITRGEKTASFCWSPATSPKYVSSFTFP